MSRLFARCLSATPPSIPLSNNEQVQKLKVDTASAMLEMDQILKARVVLDTACWVLGSGESAWLLGFLLQASTAPAGCLEFLHPLPACGAEECGCRGDLTLLRCRPMSCPSRCWLLCLPSSSPVAQSTIWAGRGVLCFGHPTALPADCKQPAALVRCHPTPHRTTPHHTPHPRSRLVTPAPPDPRREALPVRMAMVEVERALEHVASAEEAAAAAAAAGAEPEDAVAEAAEQHGLFAYRLAVVSGCQSFYWSVLVWGAADGWQMMRTAQRSRRPGSGLRWVGVRVKVQRPLLPSPPSPPPPTHTHP